jgi:hypothetical protein
MDTDDRPDLRRGGEPNYRSGAGSDVELSPHHEVASWPDFEFQKCPVGI